MKSQPNRSDAIGAPTQKPATMIGRPPVNVSTSDPYTVGDKKGRPQAPKGGKKITKADIGLPTDFRWVYLYVFLCVANKQISGFYTLLRVYPWFIQPTSYIYL